MINELPQLQHIILKNYETNTTSLSADDAALFKKWKLSLTQRDMMKLATEGENEMIDLGERYQARFPSLMPETYNNQSYKVYEVFNYFIYALIFYKHQFNVNFSSDIHPLNVQRKVQNTLLLVYLVGIIVKTFGIQHQYIEIQL